MPRVVLKPLPKLRRRWYALHHERHGHVAAIRGGKVVYGTLKQARRFKSKEEIYLYARGIKDPEIHVCIVGPG